jgi:hypothetical protein
MAVTPAAGRASLEFGEAPTRVAGKRAAIIAITPMIDVRVRM